MLNPDPLHHTRTGRCDSVAAKQAWAMTQDEDIRSRLRDSISKESLDMLRRIASGEPIRNAREVINAIKTQLTFGVAPPKQTFEVESRQTIAVINPYAVAPADALPPPLPLPASTEAKGPIIRRKQDQESE